MENTIKSFLEQLSKNYENLNENQKKHISEFYMQFQFMNKNKENEFTENNLLKFLSLGWFIYENENKNLLESKKE